MKYLKKYENHEDIHQKCREYGIWDYTINDDGSIDVDGDVNLRIAKLPLKFRNIEGHFNCGYSKLTSLEGCPKSVGGNFYCYNNKLTSLLYCPKHINVDFDCESNKIDTFEGLDFIHIRGYFYCGANPIHFIWRLFRDHTKFEFFNDCDIIRENRVIILERLNFFLDYIGRVSVTEVEGYKCI